MMPKPAYLLCQCSVCSQSAVAHPDTGINVPGCFVKPSTRLTHEKREQGLKFHLRSPKPPDDERDINIDSLTSQINNMRIQSHVPDSALQKQPDFQSQPVVSCQCLLSRVEKEHFGDFRGRLPNSLRHALSVLMN